MTLKNPYQIIKHLRVTEKAQMLNTLQTNDSNPSVRACTSPKYVFVVDGSATKKQIAMAVEEIYQEQRVKVVAVNTINVKAKARRVRGRRSWHSAFKKAIVTLDKGDTLEAL
jgi:large subunit ribosomal protein L23